MSIDTYPPQNVSAQTPTLAYAQVTAVQSGIVAITDLTGLSVTVTVPVGRRLKVTLYGIVSSTVGADTVRLHLTDASNNLLGFGEGTTSGGYTSPTVQYVVSPAAGTHTFKARLGRQQGTGTATLNADPTFPAFLLVEDITGSQLPVLPQSVPVGVLAQSIWLSTQAVVASSHVALPLSVNVAVPAGRLLRVSGRTYATNATASSRSGLYVYEDGVQKQAGFTQHAFSGNTSVEVDVILSPSAGSHTYELRGAATAGTSTFAGDSIHPAYIAVEDITPTPAPGQGAPGSTLGYAEVVAQQTGITTEVDLTGLSVTVTVPVGRRIRVTGYTNWFSTVNNDRARLNIVDGVNTQLQRAGSPLLLTTGLGSATAQVVLSPAAGTHTFKLKGMRDVGTGSLTMYALGNVPAYILVEDITGAVWPVGSQVSLGLLPSIPTVRLQHSVNVSLTDGVVYWLGTTAGATTVWDTESFDTDSMHSAVNPGRITFNTAGIYAVSFNCIIQGASDVVRSAAFIRLNGTATELVHEQSGHASSASTTPAHSLSTIYKFAAGDYIEAGVYQDNTSGAARNLLGEPRTSFSAAWLGSGS